MKAALLRWLGRLRRIPARTTPAYPSAAWLQPADRDVHDD